MEKDMFLQDIGHYDLPFSCGDDEAKTLRDNLSLPGPLLKSLEQRLSETNFTQNFGDYLNAACMVSMYPFAQHPDIDPGKDTELVNLVFTKCLSDNIKPKVRLKLAKALSLKLGLDEVRERLGAKLRKNRTENLESFFAKQIKAFLWPSACQNSETLADQLKLVCTDKATIIKYCRQLLGGHRYFDTDDSELGLEIADSRTTLNDLLSQDVLSFELISDVVANQVTLYEKWYTAHGITPHTNMLAPYLNTTDSKEPWAESEDELVINFRGGLWSLIDFVLYRAPDLMVATTPFNDPLLAEKLSVKADENHAYALQHPLRRFDTPISLTAVINGNELYKSRRRDRARLSLEQCHKLSDIRITDYASGNTFFTKDFATLEQLIIAISSNPNYKQPQTDIVADRLPSLAAIAHYSDMRARIDLPPPNPKFLPQPKPVNPTQGQEQNSNNPPSRGSGSPAQPTVQPPAPQPATRSPAQPAVQQPPQRPAAQQPPVRQPAAQQPVQPVVQQPPVQPNLAHYAGIPVAHRDKIWSDIDALAKNGNFHSSYISFWGKSRLNTMAKKTRKLFSDYTSKKKVILHPKRKHKKLADEIKDFCDTDPSNAALLNKLYKISRDNSYDPYGSFGSRLGFAFNKLEEILNPEYKPPTLK